MAEAASCLGRVKRASEMKSEVKAAVSGGEGGDRRSEVRGEGKFELKQDKWTLPGNLGYINGPSQKARDIISKVGSAYFPEISKISTSSYLSYISAYFHAYFAAYFMSYFMSYFIYRT